MTNKEILMKFISAQQQKSQPIVTDQGYKAGAPPEGSNWRIPSDTLYNPTPFNIKAVSDNGIEKTLQPFDTTNVEFPGAQYVDEYHMSHGGPVDPPLTTEPNKTEFIAKPTNPYQVVNGKYQFTLPDGTTWSTDQRDHADRLNGYFAHGWGFTGERLPKGEPAWARIPETPAPVAMPEQVTEKTKDPNIQKVVINTPQGDVVKLQDVKSKKFIGYEISGKPVNMNNPTGDPTVDFRKNLKKFVTADSNKESLAGNDADYRKGYESFTKLLGINSPAPLLPQHYAMYNEGVPYMNPDYKSALSESRRNLPSGYSADLKNQGYTFFPESGTWGIDINKQGPGEIGYKKEGGLTKFLPKAQNAGDVIPADADRYGINNPVAKGDDTQYFDPALFQQLQELQNRINPLAQSSAASKQEYEKKVLEAINRIEPQNYDVTTSGYIPESVRQSEDVKKHGLNGCISGVCYTLNEAGDPVRYYSNSMFQDAIKDGTEKNWALDFDTKNISGGDIVQFTGDHKGPHHGALVVPNTIVHNEDGTITFEVFMNSGDGPMYKRSYTVNPKDDRVDNFDNDVIQLIKRKNVSDLDNLVSQRDQLKAQIEAADPAAFKKGRARRWNTYMPGAFTEVGVDYTNFEGQDPLRMEAGSMMQNLKLEDAARLLRKTTITTPKPIDGVKIEFDSKNDIDYTALRKTAGFENILNQINDPEFKMNFMKDMNITNREYNAVVSHAFGIYGQETGFGTKAHSIKETDAARKADSVVGDIWSRLNGDGAFRRDVDEDYSRGLTQVKLRNLKGQDRRQYGINKESIESDPTKAFMAAMIVNAQNLPELRKLAANGETDALGMHNYLDYLPYMYNQPNRLRRGDRKTMEAALAEGMDPAQALVIDPNSPMANNEYIKNARTYSDLFKFMPLAADAPNKKMGGELSEYKVGGKIKRKSVDAPTADFDAMNNADKRAEYEAGWKAYSQGADQWSDMLNREEEKKGRELTREEKIAFLEKYVKPGDGERKFKYDQANDRRFDFLFNNGYQTWNTESGTPEFVFRKPVTVNEKLNDLDKELQKHAHDWTKREETPFAKSLGFDPNKSDEAKKRAWDYAHSKVGERLIAANPQGERTRVEWMNSFTPQERHIIEGGQAAYNFEPGFGTQFSSGLEKNVRNLANIAAVGPINWFNGKNEFNTALWGNDDLTKEEQNNANALGVLAPLTYSANLARGVVTGDAGRAASGNVAKPLFNGTGMSFVDPTGAAVMSELLTVGMDPLIPISAAAETGALAKGAEAFTELPGINSLYKFNPNAKGSFFKPWEGATRIINQAGYDDAVSNFAIRSAPQGALPAGETLTINGVTRQMSGRPTAWPSFSRKPNPTYLSKGQNNFIVETQHPVALSTKGRHGKGTTLFPVDAEGTYLTQIPIEDTQIYNAKPNWISGYQKAWNNPMDLDMSKLKVTMVNVPQADGSILPVKALADESGKIVSYNIADTGAFNNGVFLHPENPNYVVKAEAPWLTEREFIPDYSSFNFQDLHKDITSPNIGKIVKQQDAIPRSSNALVNDRLLMTRKMSGKSLDKYSSEQLRNIPMEAYAQLWNDAKQVRNNNLGIDFVGNNIFYDDATSQFKIIDLSPLSDDAIAVDKWNNPILKGQGPGLPTKESANILKQAIGDKLVTLHESADRRLGLPIDQYQSIFHDMYKDKMQNINKMWIQQGMYKRGGAILVNDKNSNNMNNNKFCLECGGMYKQGGQMIKRADGSYSPRGFWDNIRDNAGSGKEPTKEMLDTERELMRKAIGGLMKFVPGGLYDGEHSDQYKEGDYQLDTTTSHTLNDLNNNGWNRGLAAANTLGDPNSMLWALPNKGFGSGLKAVAGLAAGLSGAVLGYEKMFNNKETNNSTMYNSNTGEYGKTPDVLKARWDATQPKPKPIVNPVKSSMTPTAGSGMGAMEMNNNYEFEQPVVQPQPGLNQQRHGGMMKFWGGGPYDQNLEDLITPGGGNGTGNSQNPNNKMQQQWQTKQYGDSAGFIAANNALNGLGMMNDVLEAKDYEKQYNKHLRDMGNTDAMYNSSNPVNPFGSYTPNVGPGSNYSLVTNGFAQDFGTKGVAAKYGGTKQYRQGGTYHVSQDELMYILANGGEIEYL